MGSCVAVVSVGAGVFSVVGEVAAMVPWVVVSAVSNVGVGARLRAGCTSVLNMAGLWTGTLSGLMLLPVISGVTTDEPEKEGSRG